MNDVSEIFSPVNWPIVKKIYKTYLTRYDLRTEPHENSTHGLIGGQPTSLELGAILVHIDR